MSSLSVRLPDSLHEKIRELARREHVSINQFIATAVAEKASALLTVDYLEQRARRADPDVFARVLSRVPDVPPPPGDAPAIPGPGPPRIRRGARGGRPARGARDENGSRRARRSSPVGTGAVGDGEPIAAARVEAAVPP